MKPAPSEAYGAGRVESGGGAGVVGEGLHPAPGVGDAQQVAARVIGRPQCQFI
jgi:hypothetical protein